MGDSKRQNPSRYCQIWGFAYRHTLGRHLPHGVVSLRYLLPGQSRKIRTHRRLWLHGLPQIPIPLYIVMEILLWLRWELFSGWRWTLRSVRRLGPEIRNREGIGVFTQFKRVLCMVLFHCVPPSEVYAFRLYRTDQRSTVWDYIFTHELPAFHRWRDSLHGETAETVRLLGDKHLAAKMLRKRGVLVVPVIEVVPRGAVFDPSACLKEYSRLFCKPRNGSAGRGGFVVERHETDAPPKVYKTEAGVVTEPSTWSCLLEAFAMDDYLIQPFMTNHPALTGLCETEDAITVRIITEMHDSKTVRYYCAMLEIPGPRTEPEAGKKRQAATRFHVIIPISTVTGKAARLGEEKFHLPVREYYETVYAKIGRSTIPFWNELRKSALASHALFPDVYAIAWDYVVTPDGPLLLEGNTGWATRMPQIIYGGLLRDELD